MPDCHHLFCPPDGAVYTWGSNSAGQLGHGGDIGNNSAQPRAIASIRNLHITKLAAGGLYSFALTVSGALFGWGCNRFAIMPLHSHLILVLYHTGLQD